METLAEAQTLLEQLESSKLIGITVLHADLAEVTVYNDDPWLREAILEYQRERVRQLSLSQKPALYPVLED